MPMDLPFLALLSKVYQLTYLDFHFLKNLNENEIYDFIVNKHQMQKTVFVEQIKNWRQNHKQWLDVKVLHPEHSKYPICFKEVPAPPVYISYIGDIEILDRPQVSVIGSRAPQFRFIEWLETHFFEFLQKRDVCVVSGGAIGIDQKVSCLALAAGKRTIQFLPSGLHSIYPKNIRTWTQDSRILCLSEYIPSQAMQKHHFVIRNRLVAALGRFLFVVQAAQKSGSMITARYAMDFGRDIATLSDFPGHSESSGNLTMIKEGAHILQTVEDLLTLNDRLCF